MSADRVTSLFWLGISVAVAVASYRLGLGNVSAPGSGFVPFGASALLGLLSIVLFLRAIAGKEQKGPEPALFLGTYWARVVSVFVALFVYAWLVPIGGYNITTFLLMVFLFRIAGRQKALKLILYALITTGLSYYVFSKWLNLQFPVGPIGF